MPTLYPGQGIYLRLALASPIGADTLEKPYATVIPDTRRTEAIPLNDADKTVFLITFDDAPAGDITFEVLADPLGTDTEDTVVTPTGRVHTHEIASRLAGFIRILNETTCNMSVVVQKEIGY